VKILSKRHPLHGVVPMDITNWAHIHLVRPDYTPITYPVKRLERKMFVVEPESALNYINVSKMVEHIKHSLRADETKITDFGDGDFTFEMWVKL
jgi:hypothetical protein